MPNFRFFSSEDSVDQIVAYVLNDTVTKAEVEHYLRTAAPRLTDILLDAQMSLEFLLECATRKRDEILRLQMVVAGHRTMDDADQSLKSYHNRSLDRAWSNLTDRLQVIHERMRRTGVNIGPVPTAPIADLDPGWKATREIAENYVNLLAQIEKMQAAIGIVNFFEVVSAPRPIS